MRRQRSSTLNESSLLERTQHPETSTRDHTVASHSSRFPVLQQFLAALSEIHDQNLTNLSGGGGPLPVVDDPRYSSQLMQEIDRVIGLTSGNVAGWGEATLEDRLGKLEISVGVMVDHFRRLEQRQTGAKEQGVAKVTEKVEEAIEAKMLSKESLKSADVTEQTKSTFKVQIFRHVLISIPSTLLPGLKSYCRQVTGRPAGW
ncbi:hypothetical protein pipiens_017172 [Culex pipiens pipiens]|uniref:Uncharacterized protein n=1 Tax=Culex pipiens pipiens TaxID=38569 RepID=A0ABD1CIZ9_CULPP